MQQESPERAAAGGVWMPAAFRFAWKYELFGSFSSGFGSVSRTHGPRMLGDFFRDAQFRDKTKLVHTASHIARYCLCRAAPHAIGFVQCTFSFSLDMRKRIGIFCRGGRGGTGHDQNTPDIERCGVFKQLVFLPPAVVVLPERVTVCGMFEGAVSSFRGVA